jgi:hypothetical protein
VQRDGQLDRSEAAREVATYFRAERDQVLAELPRNLRQLRTPQLAKRARFIDRP